MAKHNLYIIAGPNGAGKTTTSFSLLPDVFHCKQFVNADEIARGISPFAPEEVTIQAGRIMLKRIEELLSQGVDFAIETTLSTRSYIRLVKKAQAMGYKVFLVFLYLESVEQAQMRVQQRVNDGGHNIPSDTIKRRFYLGIKNLLELYIPICDYVAIYNNAHSPTVLVAKKNGRLQILNHDMWNQINKMI
ncbi:MAG: zeta toxin family protein [Paludibacteraceae bacterium]|nr:zeta toxin family protein [Paludibacteraceae bacterium]